MRSCALAGATVVCVLAAVVWFSQSGVIVLAEQIFSQRLDFTGAFRFNNAEPSAAGRERMVRRLAFGMPSPEQLWLDGEAQVNAHPRISDPAPVVGGKPVGDGDAPTRTRVLSFRSKTALAAWAKRERSEHAGADAQHAVGPAQVTVQHAGSQPLSPLRHQPAGQAMPQAMAGPDDKPLSSGEPVARADALAGSVEASGGPVEEPSSRLVPPPLVHHAPLRQIAGVAKTAERSAAIITGDAPPPYVQGVRSLQVPEVAERRMGARDVRQGMDVQGETAGRVLPTAARTRLVTADAVREAAAVASPRRHSDRSAAEQELPDASLAIEARLLNSDLAALQRPPPGAAAHEAGAEPEDGTGAAREEDAGIAPLPDVHPLRIQRQRMELRAMMAEKRAAERRLRAQQASVAAARKRQEAKAKPPTPAPAVANARPAWARSAFQPN
jgi:hypothetical protein